MSTRIDPPHPTLEDVAPTASAADRLITPEEVRRRLTARDPSYGADFTPADWSRIAERLCALARLLWRISCRELETERQRPQVTNGEETELGAREQ